jgi:hypothetical protein
MIMRKALGATCAILFAAAAPAVCQPTGTDAGNNLPIATTPPCNDFNIQLAVTTYSNHGDHVDLGRKQRACIYLGNLFSESAVLGSLASSGLSQWRKSNPEFGLGAEGYAKRVGTKYTEGMTKATAEYLSAWVFRENPKPPTSRCSSWHRAFCAAGSMVVGQNSSGQYRPIFSKVLGAAADGFIGTEWYADDSWKAVVRRSGVSLATSLAYAEIAEFEPDIFRWLGKLFSTKGKSGDGGPPVPGNVAPSAGAVK